MGAFGNIARFLVPLGEAGGDYLQRRDIANYGNQMRQRQTQALMESFKQLGPEGETLAGEIGRGLPPEAASSLLPLLQRRSFQRQLSDEFAKSGGKLTPEFVAKVKLESGGDIDLTSLLKATGGGDLTTAVKTKLQELGVTPEAFAAMTPEQKQKLFAKAGGASLGDAPTGDPNFDAWRKNNPFANTLPAEKAYAAFRQMAKPTTAEVTAEEEASGARKGFDVMLSYGKAILPSNPTTATALEWRAKREAMRLRGDPAILGFDAASGALIQHLRAIAGAARVNQAEVDQINKAIGDAQSYEGLREALKVASGRLDEYTARIQARHLGSIGGLGDVGGPPAGGTVNLIVPGATSTDTDGKPIYMWSDGNWHYSRPK